VAEMIVALDYPDLESALNLVDRVGDRADFYKVGLELYTRVGPPVLEALAARRKRVFLDLKLHDIPHTVAGAVRAAAGHRVELLTVHATGGPAMLEAAVDAAVRAEVEVGHRVRLLAVTVLTSLPPHEVEAIWGREVDSVRDEVLRLAEMSQAAGVDGVVASAHEAEVLRRRLGAQAPIVTPGIRPAGADAHDQARVATPAQAVQAGASHLVLGRAVTQAPDPASAFASIVAEAKSG